MPANEQHPDNPAPTKSPISPPGAPALAQAIAALQNTVPEWAQDDAARFVEDFARPAQVMEAMKIRRTIVIFGSARLRAAAPADPANAAHAPTPDSGQRPTEAPDLGACLDAAREAAEHLTRWSLSRFVSPQEQYVVCTGGGPGIMEAACQGARAAGGLAIGLNIHIPHEQHPNPHVSQGLDYPFHSFLMRKFWLTRLARAALIFPGGIGTIDELSDLLTTVYTDKHHGGRIPIVLFGRDYWRQVIDFDTMLRCNMISHGLRDLIQLTDSTEEAVSLITRKLEQGQGVTE